MADQFGVGKKWDGCLGDGGSGGSERKSHGEPLANSGCLIGMVAFNNAPKRPLFVLGQVVATPGALEALGKSGESAASFLVRHARGDWGDVDGEDGELNDHAVLEGSRIVSAYRTRTNEKLWIITEADRASTCVLLPSEY